MIKLILLLLSIMSFTALAIDNSELKKFNFLESMEKDAFFPSHLVSKGKGILVNLCNQIESQNPKGNEVYSLIHMATLKFNELAIEFENQGSEIETVARENIGGDILYILNVYGYKVDIEKAIAARDW